MHAVVRIFRKIGLLLWSLLWLSSQAWANETLDAASIGHEPVSLTTYLAVLEDTGASLAFSDVVRAEMAERFMPVKKPTQALGFSYTSSAIWLRLHLTNPSDKPVERMLEISYALLAEVDFYRANANGRTYQKVEAGYARAPSGQLHPSRYIALPLALPAHADQYLYVRVQSKNSLNIPARLWSVDAFRDYQTTDYALQALYFGVVLAIALYNLILFVALRDISYLLYVVFATSVCLALATFTGMGSEFIWGLAPVWTQKGINTSSTIAAIVMLMFARRMLSTREVMPRMDPWLKGFMGINAVVFFALIFWFAAFVPYFVVINTVTSLLILGAGIVGAFKKQRSAYFFVAAFLVLFLANALSNLRNLGILPTNFLTSGSLQIGSAIEMMLLSLTLVDRFNTLRREKLEAQAQALLVQTEMVSKLKVSEQLLEARVAERTAQLQVLNQQLEHMSTTDALTGLPNRRQFDAVLASEWARAVRHGQPLALGVIDLDWFKQYNDNYGHQAGDECLKQVAAALAQTISRSSDLVARYGGEEFVFIAPETNRENALYLAESVRRAVAQLALPHAFSDYGRLTLSIGVATCIPKRDELPDALLRTADAMLYQAKAQGRNRVIVAY
jgi:two-component system, sensor histidine kinase LadS